MNIHPRKPLFLYPLLLTALFAPINTSFAEKIYHWKDNEGKTHYTNNQALVPLDSSNTHIIKMKALPAPEPEPINGQALWNNLCAQCHRIQTESYKGKQGITNLIADIRDPNATPESGLKILQAAIEGDMDDNIKSLSSLNNKELTAIIQYITQEVERTTPPSADTPTAK